MADAEQNKRAHDKLKLQIEHLQTVDRDWSRVTPSLRAIAISEARHNLADVVTILMGGEGSDRS